eukprot:gene22906-29672_t
MGPKKARKTKAELEAERLLREEEERKAKLLEEKRINEEIEAKRIEDLRIQKENYNFRISEISRLEIEFNNMLERLKDLTSQRIAEEALEAEKLNWEKFKNPSDEPDASNQRDMNTFISLTNELEVKEFPETLDIIEKIERVASNMDEVWSDRLADGDSKALHQSFNYLNDFSNMIVNKLDKATAHCMRFVDNIWNDKQEMHIEFVISSTSIGLWGNFSESRMDRLYTVNYEKLGVQIDIPKQILQNEVKYLNRIIRTPVDIYSCRSYDSSSYSNYYVVGDILLFDFLIAPPLAYHIQGKHWTLRDNSLLTNISRKSAYPSSVSSRCYIKVPDNLIMSDDIHIALWDHDKNDWTTDKLSDYQYSESTRVVQFFLLVTGTLALVKKRHSDLPYRQWSLVPVIMDDVNIGKSAKFTLQTQKYKIVIEIIGTHVKLIAPDIPSISTILNKEMTPGQLVRKLLRHGINISPVYQDASYMDNQAVKISSLEDDVLLSMARCASSIEFKSSEWNGSIENYQIGLLARETSVYVGNVENYDYDCILAEVDNYSESYKNSPDAGDIPGSAKCKYTLVVGNDYGNRKLYSHIPRQDEETHVDFLQALNSRITQEAKDKIENGNERFHQTVY